MPRTSNTTRDKSKVHSFTVNVIRSCFRRIRRCPASWPARKWHRVSTCLALSPALTELRYQPIVTVLCTSRAGPCAGKPYATSARSFIRYTRQELEALGLPWPPQLWRIVNIKEKS